MACLLLSKIAYGEDIISEDFKRILAPRKRVFYRAAPRDPFSWSRSSVEKRKRPSVGSLMLVGVVRDTRGWKALIEDRDGKGYVFRLGDKVQGGFLSLITPDKVVFTLREKGRMTLRELKLGGEEEQEGQIEIQVMPGGRTGPGPSGMNRGGTLHPVAPKRGQMISQRLKFQWTPFPARDVSYDLFIYKFGKPIFVRRGLKSCSYELEDLSMLPRDVSLYWEVSAVDSSGAVLASSEDGWNFCIIGKDNLGFVASGPTGRMPE